MPAELSTNVNTLLQVQKQTLETALETGVYDSAIVKTVTQGEDQSENNEDQDATTPQQVNTEQEHDQHPVITTPTVKRNIFENSSEDSVDTSDTSSTSDSDSSESDGNKKGSKKKKKKRRLRRLRRKDRRYEETYENKPFLKSLMPTDIIEFLKEFDGWERKLAHRFRLKHADLMICIHHNTLEQLSTMQINTTSDRTIRKYLDSIRKEYEEESKNTLFDRITKINFSPGMGSLLTSAQKHISKVEEEIGGLSLGRDSKKDYTFILSQSKVLSQFDWNMIDLRTRKQTEKGHPRIFISGTGRMSKIKSNKSSTRSENKSVNTSMGTHGSSSRSKEGVSRGPITKYSLKDAQSRVSEIRNVNTFPDSLKAQLVDCLVRGLCTKCRDDKHPSNGCDLSKEEAIKKREEYNRKHPINISQLLEGFPKINTDTANTVTVTKSQSNSNAISNDVPLTDIMANLNTNKKSTANMIRTKEYLEDIEYEKDLISENLTYWMNQSETFNKYDGDEYLEKQLKTGIKNRKYESKIKNRKYESQIKNKKYENEIKNIDKEKFYSNEHLDSDLMGKEIKMKNTKIYESHSHNKKMLNNILAVNSSRIEENTLNTTKSYETLNKNSKIEYEDHQGIKWRNFSRIKKKLSTACKRTKCINSNFINSINTQEDLSNSFPDLDSYEESWELGYGENTKSDFDDFNKEKIKEENEIKSI
eukprot:augustus_masked-scaffold_45-processed-gene-1.117-mRNA-1 protein AED:1.00 eAED:1.00 QI:0/0/0/0/1/1/2/0/701